MNSYHMEWHVIYTKPRWEKKVSDLLEKKGIITYCPLVTEVRQWSDRKKKITTPLFKSYVFVKLDEKDRFLVFDVPGVVKYLYWLGKPAIVRQEEIDTIKNWLDDERVKFTEIHHLTPGDHLTIAGGSLKGKEAQISEMGSRRIRLVLKDMGLVVNVKISEAIEQ